MNYIISCFIIICRLVRSFMVTLHVPLTTPRRREAEPLHGPGSLHSRYTRPVRGLRRLRHEGGEWWPKRSDKGTKNRPSPRPSLLTPLVARVPRVWLVPLAYASGTKDEPHEWVRSVSVSLRFTPSFTHPFATPRFAVSSLVAAGVDGEGEVSEERDPRERDRRSLRSSLRFITCFPSVSRS